MSGVALPKQIDVLVVGGGTAGAALAGLLARDTSQTVVLLEAGPDYGPRDSGRWPAALLDARRFGLTHDWEYSCRYHAAQPADLPVPRARVIGGCSAHNGCVAVVGHRRDYDAWEARGNPGWGWESVAPAFERAKAALRVRIPDDSEVNPFQWAYLTAAVAAGHPRVADLNDPDLNEGVAPAPFNIHDGVRWNAAFGYLDPVRERANLTIVPHALVDRVVIEHGRAVAVEALLDGVRQRVAAGKVVLAAGAYGSPAVLLRSGVGAPEQLRDLGVAVAHPLPGVGHGLTDHPLTQVELRVTPAFQRAMEAHEAEHWTPDEQVVLLSRSSRAGDAFDIHIPAYSTRDPRTGQWRFQVSVAQFSTAGSAALTLASRDPQAAPRIDHGYLNDAEEYDQDVLLDGVAQTLEIAEQMRAAGVVDAVLAPAAGLSRAELLRYVQETVHTCYHPSSSCRMGPATDTNAVVDADGRVHGLSGLYVCDASIFPFSLRANLNLPSAMAAEQLAPRIAANV
jgi:choline dehydrogenase